VRDERDLRWARLERRAELLRRLREWFLAAGFLEVETPLMVPSPGTETHLDPIRVELRPTPGPERETRWLITSPEYAMKRLLAEGSGPIWQLARVFRDGERGKNHRP
jgi:elongation factor P--(R)-beta-lysine ligase